MKEKLEAASDIKLKKVLIAKGTGNPSPILNSSNSTNETLNLVSYGKENLSLEVVEVIDLDEVLFHLTGKDLNHRNNSFIINPQYNKIMQSLQTVLCDRTEQLEKELKIKGKNFTEEIKANKGKALNATRNEDYYSGASYCFGNNIKVKSQYYKEQKPSVTQFAVLFKNLKTKTTALERRVDLEKIETISDLQTMMVVKERINNIKEQLEKENSTDINELANLLGYSEERFYSALSWMQFFSMEGKKYQMDKDSLKNSCLQKIAESEERHQYASIYLGSSYLKNIKRKIASSRIALENNETALCLILASQAKADANAILSTLGLQEEALLEYIKGKSKAAERIIFENSAEGIFPILGYSYYQYANSLKEQEKYTSLVYLEYALEMSELSIYFPEEEDLYSFYRSIRFNKNVLYFSQGFIFGVLLTLLLITLRKVRKSLKEKKENNY